MEQIDYNFVDLETDESFELLARRFGGMSVPNTVNFDNSIVKGELVRKAPENGLWIRRWKLTTFQKIVLHKGPAPVDHPRKFNLIYFLNPSIFDLKSGSKKVSITNKRNNLFLSNQVMMDFSVLPKQPFYVLDITFTASWLVAQFNDADNDFKERLEQCLNIDPKMIIMKPCLANEYRILHEIDECIANQSDDNLFIRSRTYQLICSFVQKVCNKKESDQEHSSSYYEQIFQAENLIMTNLKNPPRLSTIAKLLNISISVLVRHFKTMYGKSVQAYCLDKRMELAKKMIIEDGVSINTVAKELGYKQASPFIETFTKRYGYSPGSLK